MSMYLDVTDFMKDNMNARKDNLVRSKHWNIVAMILTDTIFGR
jgi:hypothetical protein